MLLHVSSELAGEGNAWAASSLQREREGGRDITHELVEKVQINSSISYPGSASSNGNGRV